MNTGNAPPRIAGLDAVRGVCALYVVVHHCWLMTFPGYPANTGPGWLGWLVYGRFAVVAFIVLSGFSLAIGPARDGWRLGSLTTFVERRLNRILAPYWAALAISLAIATVAPGLPLVGAPTLRSVVVYGLLLQDVVAAPAPNGAFWSIGAEVVLYLAFPVLLLLRRRAGAVVTLVTVVGPVAVVGALGSRNGALTGYAFELAPLFTLGMVAAGVVTVRRRVPWHGLAAVAAAPVVAVTAVKGPLWTVGHFYWIDLAAGPAIALFLAAVATGRITVHSRRLHTLGGFSYSLYLIHLPIVAFISREVVAPYVVAGVPAFCATVILAVPTTLAAARFLARLVESPYVVTISAHCASAPGFDVKSNRNAPSDSATRLADPDPYVRPSTVSRMIS